MRKILPITVKRECTPDSGEDSDIWSDVVACGETDGRSDMSSSVHPDGTGASDRHGSFEHDGYPSALLSSKSKTNVESDPEAGKLWDPNYGELRGLNGADPVYYSLWRP